MGSFRNALVGATIVAVAAARAGAHEESTSHAACRADGQEFSCNVTVAMRDWIEAQKTDENGDGRVDDGEFERARGRMAEWVTLAYDVWNDGQRCQHAKAETTREGDQTTTQIKFHCGSGIRALRLDARLFREQHFRHTHVVSLAAGGRVHTVPFGPSSAPFDVDAGVWPQVASFIWLGVTHLFLGVDHIAFLVALLLVAATIGSLIKIVTSFTVAHSITLALSALNVVDIPARFIEPAIALSILFVATENIARRDPRWHGERRWLITFLFGLIHGFGFASVLREMNLTSEGLAVSLVSFNVGVEIGQLAIVAALFWPLRRILRSAWSRRFVVAASSVVMALGGYWLVDRLT